MQNQLLSREAVAEIMTARGFPMSRGRVYQLEQRALCKLRHALKDLAAEACAADVADERDVAAARRRAERILES